MVSPNIASLIESVQREKESLDTMLGSVPFARYVAMQEVARGQLMRQVSVLKRQRNILIEASKSVDVSPEDRAALEEGIDRLREEIDAYSKVSSAGGYVDVLAQRQEKYDDIIRRLSAGEDAPTNTLLNSVARQCTDMATHMASIGSHLCSMAAEIESRGGHNIVGLQNIVGEIKSMRKVIREGWVGLFDDIEQLEQEGWK